MPFPIDLEMGLGLVATKMSPAFRDETWHPGHARGLHGTRASRRRLVKIVLADCHPVFLPPMTRLFIS